MATALDSKNRKLANSFKERLELLECPFTEGVEESWILELLFQPGEPRLRLLQWLFVKLDQTLEEAIDPLKYAVRDTKMDSRVQRMLFVASTLGLCRPDDVEIIRGTCSQTKQVLFMDHLLSIVCIKDKAEDPRTISPGHISSRGNSLKEQFRSDCYFLDTLVQQEKIETTFSKQVQLLPPDLERKLEEHRRSKGLSDKNSILVPDVKKIQESAMKLSQDLAKHQDMLNELLQVYTAPNLDFHSRERITRTLSLKLTEMSQLVVGFSYCFENELRPWCNRKAPIMSTFGPTAKRVLGLLHMFVKMLGCLSQVHANHTLMSTVTKEKAAVLMQASKQLDVQGQRTTKYLQECIDTLENSMLRNEQSLLRSPNTTINVSAIQL